MQVQLLVRSRGTVVVSKADVEEEDVRERRQVTERGDGW